MAATCGASCFAATLFAAPPIGLKDFKCEPAPEMNVLFQQRAGWIGGDGAYSASLRPANSASSPDNRSVASQRTLWLFSDTWVGKIENGHRTEATIVNNTAAIQSDVGDAAKIKFFIRRDAADQPTALIAPSDGRGWFWLQAAQQQDGKLYIFLAQIEKNGEPGVFGFRQIGQWLGVVDNPDAEPTAWHITQQRLPNCVFSPARVRCFGAAVLPVGDDLIVYGIDEDRAGSDLKRRLIVAKAPAAKLSDLAAWQYFDGVTWQQDAHESAQLADGLATEFSVSWLPEIRQYVLVYTENGMSPNILARTAAQPEGPWSEPVAIYKCPDAVDEKRVFCYAAKAHPELSGSGDLLISYATNSTDFQQVASDARLYWPRFVRLKFSGR